MNLIVKSVALALAITLLAAPAAALSECWTSSDEVQHGCPPGCPMMAMMNAHQTPDTVQAVPSGTTCCEVSSGKPTPITQLQVPTSGSRAAVTPAVSSDAFTAAPVPASTHPPGPTPALPPSSPQAVLCTFLI